MKNFKLGQARKGTTEYTTWKEMRKRCRSENRPDYNDYGGRGIKVCKRWDDFELFFLDVGPRPSPTHQLDRINNDKGYSPDNCKWSTPKENNNHRRDNRLLEYRGVTKTVSQWSELTGINMSTLRGRMERGWKPEEVLKGKKNG